MKLFTPTLAGTAPTAWLSNLIQQNLSTDRADKFKAHDWQNFDVRSHAWSEGGQLMQSLNQANGVMTLHGMLVHGSAASLLALGGMAAMDRESSYEMVMASAKAAAAVTKVELVDQWAAIAADTEVAQPKEPQTSKTESEESDVFLATETLHEIVSEIENISLNMQAESQRADAGFTQLELAASELELLDEAVIDSSLNDASNFSFEVLNQRQESLLDATLSDEDRLTFAGKAAPATLVEVLNQHGEVMGSSVVDASGNWFIQLQKPLAEGDYEFRLFTTDTQGVREIAAEPIRLVVVQAKPVESDDVSLSDLISAVPLITTVPLIDTASPINLTPVEPVIQPAKVDFAFGLSELLPVGESDLFLDEMPLELSPPLDELSLQMLIHPQGGITLWEEEETLMLTQLGDVASFVANPLEPLLDNRLSDNTY
ncbi:Ig-like domain-containing protein [Pantoea sp. USHLN256]|uniref:Ig-like domain-containing protein n=1 Tax=Pantoea sp. USHLN256 TaxID=3081293 RepID=UPI003018DE22